jgi:hypothetical protein
MSGNIETRNTRVSLWTRFAVWFRLHVRPFCREHKWTLLFGSGVVAFGAGIWGFWILRSGLDESPLNIVYLTLQLFMLRSGEYPGPINVQLEFARFFAPLLTSVSIFVVISEFIYKDLQLIWLKLFGGDHIIVIIIKRANRLL